MKKYTVYLMSYYLDLLELTFYVDENQCKELEVLRKLYFYDVIKIKEYTNIISRYIENEKLQIIAYAIQDVETIMKDN